MKREIKFRAWDEYPKYEIGDDGSVYSLNYNHSGIRRIIKQHPDKDGYPYVFLVINGKRYKRMVHRMVAITFIKNTENKPQVNHKNGVRNDNRVDNLEWVTHQENCLHGYYSNGRTTSLKAKHLSKLRFLGVNNPKAKMTFEKAEQIRSMRLSGNSLKDISDKYKISDAQVSAICNNKFWKRSENPHLLTH